MADYYFLRNNLFIYSAIFHLIMIFYCRQKKTQKSEAYGLGLDSLVLMIKQIRTFIHIDLINNLILGQVDFEHLHG